MESEVRLEMLVAQSSLTLHDPMNCSPPDSSVHGILQARILEWVAISFSKSESVSHSDLPRSKSHCCLLAMTYRASFLTSLNHYGNIAIK